MTILHVSDTQFGRYHRFADGVDSLASHLLRDIAVMRDADVPAIDVVVLSGDIAEQGRRSEYEQARAFIDALCESTGVDHGRVVVVPGNHDVNWALCEAYFADCRGREEQPREPFHRKWQLYQDFVTGLHGPAAFTEDQPYRLHRFDDLRLTVAALNSTMYESHREDGHYGCCGKDQLYWFERGLREATSTVRLAVVHHNARRRAVADNENLRDEEDLTRILGPHLDLVLHGHTHEGREDRLADGTLVLATGSAAVTSEWRPSEVRNQYQILRLSAKGRGLTRWAREWDGQHSFRADSRIGGERHPGRAVLAFDPPGWRPASDVDQGQERWTRAAASGRLAAEHGQEADFVSQVLWVTRRDVGRDAGDVHIDRRSKGQPPLDYLIAIRPAAPLRCAERSCSSSTAARRTRSCGRRRGNAASRSRRGQSTTICSSRAPTPGGCAPSSTQTRSTPRVCTFRSGSGRSTDGARTAPSSTRTCSTRSTRACSTTRAASCSSSATPASASPSSCAGSPT